MTEGIQDLNKKLDRIEKIFSAILYVKTQEVDEVNEEVMSLLNDMNMSSEKVGEIFNYSSSTVRGRW